MRESVTYLQIYFAGSLGFVMYNVLVGILQAVGDSRHPLYYLIVSSVINLVLDLLFITGFHTGVGGAACNRDLSDRECTPLFLAAAADKGKLWIENSKNSF